jgi:signal transduction histidine kinase
MTSITCSRPWAAISNCSCKASRRKILTRPGCGHVARSIDRAAQLVRQLLLFGRKAGSRRVRVDLNQEVEEAARMLERTIPKMIALELHLDPSAWPLFADPVQIEQILLNLASNAVDAMPDGGKLMVETSNVTLDEIS